MDQAAVVSRAGRGSAARSVFTMLMNWASVAQVTEGEVELQPALVGCRAREAGGGQPGAAGVSGVAARGCRQRAHATR